MCQIRNIPTRPKLRFGEVPLLFTGLISMKHYYINCFCADVYAWKREREGITRGEKNWFIYLSGETVGSCGQMFDCPWLLGNIHVLLSHKVLVSCFHVQGQIKIRIWGSSSNDMKHTDTQRQDPLAYILPLFTASACLFEDVSPRVSQLLRSHTFWLCVFAFVCVRGEIQRESGEVGTRWAATVCPGETRQGC